MFCYLFDYHYYYYYYYYYYLLLIICYYYYNKKNNNIIIILITLFTLLLTSSFSVALPARFPVEGGLEKEKKEKRIKTGGCFPQISPILIPLLAVL
jgi:hypothetical protein